MGKDLRGTWSQALLTFFFPIVLILTIRWLLVEPYVIPSGSMLPTLQIHDHIMVNKLAFGMHWPFSKKWLWHWSTPEKGEIVVFRYPQNPEIFYVKRVQAVAGDELSMENGQIQVNGQKLDLTSLPHPAAEDEFSYFKERNYTVRYLEREISNFHKIKVPENHFFVIGDNRDQSSDSRVWGFVPVENLVGRASFIWLACHETLASANFLCDPRSITWDRLLLSAK